jgi:ribosomal protein S18 acetylase RimI-like enzyme
MALSPDTRTAVPPLALRPQVEADAPFLRALDAQVRTRELGLGLLPPEVLSPLLAQQFAAREAGLRARYPHCQEQVVLVVGEPAGRLWVDRGERELHLVDVALEERWRGRGTGTRLLRELQQEAARRGLPLRLTVRRNNPALRLYSRMGFVEEGGTELDLQLVWNVRGTSAAEEEEP